jgi:hypothetical protein
MAKSQKSATLLDRRGEWTLSCRSYSLSSVLAYEEVGLQTALSLGNGIGVWNNTRS